jgi:hypothetical protein
MRNKLKIKLKKEIERQAKKTDRNFEGPKKNPPHHFLQILAISTVFFIETAPSASPDSLPYNPEGRKIIDNLLVIEDAPEPGEFREKKLYIPFFSTFDLAEEFLNKNNIGFPVRVKSGSTKSFLSRVKNFSGLAYLDPGSSEATVLSKPEILSVIDDFNEHSLTFVPPTKSQNSTPSYIRPSSSTRQMQFSTQFQAQYAHLNACMEEEFLKRYPLGASTSTLAEILTVLEPIIAPRVTYSFEFSKALKNSELAIDFNDKVSLQVGRLMVCLANFVYILQFNLPEFEESKFVLTTRLALLHENKKIALPAPPGLILSISDLVKRDLWLYFSALEAEKKFIVHDLVQQPPKQQIIHRI